MELTVYLLILVVGGVGLALAARRRVRSWQDLPDSSDWLDDGFRSPVEVIWPWTRVDGEPMDLEAYRAEATLQEEVRGEDGIEIHANIQSMVVVGWGERHEGLRWQINGLVGAESDIANALFYPDNFQAPGDGFCHAAPGLAAETGQRVAQSFAELAWLLEHGLEGALPSFLKGAKTGQDPANVEGLLYRHLPEHPEVLELAWWRVARGAGPRWLSAAKCIGAEMAPALEKRLLAGGFSDDEVSVALGLALAWAGEGAAALLVRALEVDALCRAAVEEASKRTDPELRPPLIKLASLPPSAGLFPDLARAFGSFDDARTARRLAAWIDDDDPTVRMRAASSLRKRKDPHATTGLVFALEGPHAGLAVELLGQMGTVDAVLPLRQLGREDRDHRDAVEDAVARIQERAQGGGAGALALSEEGGGLALAAQDGGVAVVDEPKT